MASIRIAPSALHSLARKYRTLAMLRRESQWGRRLDVEAELTLLAREFPGALRELDTLPLAEIDRRLGAVERALDSGRAEAWILWMSRYHSYMRAALWLRRRALDPGSDPSPELIEDLSAYVRREAGVRWDVGFVRAIVAPSGGRVGRLVLDRLEGELGVSPDVLARALFHAHLS